MSLSRNQKRYLLGLSHRIKPVVTVAAKGLSENVLAEINLALAQHELIKIKLRTERQLRKAFLQQILEHSGAELVQAIGHTASIYKRNPEKSKLALPE